MNHRIAWRLRQIHRHIGLFFTPAILFFCLSGALQALGLHEDKSGRTQPQAWIATIASIHKDQRLPRAEREGPPPEFLEARQGPSKQKSAGPRREHRETGPSPIPLKAFVLLLAVGLSISALLGATIALTNRASRRPAIAALALGTLLPVVLLFL
jgi:hypothetical protein